jgi:hypothetical protein
MSLPPQYKLADEILKRLQLTKVASIDIFKAEYENTNAAIDRLVKDDYAEYTEDKKGIIITPLGEFFDGYEKEFSRRKIFAEFIRQKTWN